MGNLTYVKASMKQQKKTCKGLTKEQKDYIKAKEAFEQADKELGVFWRVAPRDENGAVDFKHLDETTLNWFDYIVKIKDKAMDRMHKLEEQIDVDYTLTVYQQINTHSMSF